MGRIGEERKKQPKNLTRITILLEKAKMIDSTWRACPILILKTATNSADLLQEVLVVSTECRSTLLQLDRLHAEKAHLRQEILSCFDTWLSYTWLRDLPAKEKQRNSNLLVKVRKKLLKQKQLTTQDIHKAQTFVDASEIALLLDYQQVTAKIEKLNLEWQSSLEKITTISDKHLFNVAKEIFKIPSITPSLFLEHRNVKYTDRRRLFNNIMHITLKTGMSSDINLLYMGTLQTNEGLPPLESFQPSLQASRLVILELWALRAIARALHLNSNWIIPSMNWKQLLGKMYRETTVVERSRFLEQLIERLDSYEKATSSQDAKQELERCITTFEMLTGTSGKRTKKRHRFFLNTLQIGSDSFSIGKEAAQVIEHTGQLIGQYVECIASKMRLQLSNIENPRDSDFAEAARLSLESLVKLDHDKRPHQGLAFFYGIDFSLLPTSEEHEIIISDVNLFPGGMGMLAGRITHKALQKSQNMLAYSLLDAAQGFPVDFLVDSDAWKQNTRWNLELRAIHETYNHLTGLNSAIIPFYPEPDKALRNNKGKWQFQKRPLNVAYCCVRDGFFSQAANFSSLSDIKMLNDFCFMYLLENKVILGEIICFITKQHPDLRIRTRASMVFNPKEFIDVYQLNGQLPPISLEAWSNLYRDLVKQLGENIFIKPAWGKAFRPSFVNIATPLGVRILFNAIQKRKNAGDNEIILEEMLPTIDEFWLQQQGRPYSSELRCFFVRSVN